MTMLSHFSFLHFRYNVVILLVTYVSPIIAIGLITIHMTIVLWCRQPLCIITPQLERAKNKKQKVKISIRRLFCIAYKNLFMIHKTAKSDYLHFIFQYPTILSVLILAFSKY